MLGRRRRELFTTEGTEKKLSLSDPNPIFVPFVFFVVKSDSQFLFGKDRFDHFN